MFNSSSGESNPTAIAAYGAGGLFAFGWFIFIDACTVHSVERLLPPIELAHVVPGLISTFALLMTCSTPFTAFSNDSMLSSNVSCARVWLFSAFVTSFASMIMSVAISESMAYGSESRFAYAGIDGTGGSGGESKHRWVGTATLMQTVCIFSASLLWISTRLQQQQY